MLVTNSAMRRLHSTRPAACRRCVGAQRAVLALCASRSVGRNRMPGRRESAPVPTEVGVEDRRRRVVDG
jgi:hypothetical protein